MKSDNGGTLAIQSISVPMGKEKEYAKTISLGDGPEFPIQEIITLLETHGLSWESAGIGYRHGTNPAVPLYVREIQEFYTDDGHYYGPYCELKILIGRLKVHDA